MHINKELTPVIYNESGVKTLRSFSFSSRKTCFPLHWHDRIEFIIIREGKFQFFLDDKLINTLSVGDVAIIPPRQSHKGIAGEFDVVYDVIMFELDTFINSAPITNRMLTSLKCGQIKLLPHSQCLWEAANEVLKMSDQSSMNLVGSIYKLLGVLFDTCIVSYQEPKLVDQRFVNVIEYIHAHFTEQLTTARVSTQFGYEESYFCRKFKKETGLSLLRYIEVLRMDLAQTLLWNTDFDISHIAVQCGFIDTCYFSHRFKKHVGQSPSSFRDSKN